MPRTVLVPVDGSPLSSRALRHALREFSEAEIAAYHVIDLFEPDYADEAVASIYEPMLGSDEWYRFVGERRDRLFAEVDEIAADYDRSVATDSDIGDPTRLVLEYAADEDVDHVVPVPTDGLPRSARCTEASPRRSSAGHRFQSPSSGERPRGDTPTLFTSSSEGDGSNDVSRSLRRVISGRGGAASRGRVRRGAGRRRDRPDRRSG